MLQAADVWQWVKEWQAASLLLSDAGSVECGGNPQAEIQGDSDIVVITALTQNFNRDILIQTKKQRVNFSSVLNNSILNKLDIFTHTHTMP